MKPSAVAAGLFLRGFLQVAPTGANVYLLGNRHWWAAFPTAYWISYVWRKNARSAAREFGGFTDHAYALGAASGCIGGAMLMAWWLK